MNRINVTKTFLPPLEEYEYYLNKIWDNDQLTNQGPLLHEFEEKAAGYLEVKRLHLVSNGTMALQVALRALEIDEGEIITTPFTYVATTSSILWERFKPVFIDIEPKTFCIDSSKIEAAITDKTKAIMPVHVFGNPCDVEMIEKIAKKHTLKVIYDAAHAFGVKYKGRSLLDYGDVSTCSFHSTKLFHTIEGGAIVTKDKAFNYKIELMKRFGHNNDKHLMLGINAKASEFQAAMGLANLKYVDHIINERKDISNMYDQLLNDSAQRPVRSREVIYNYAYYPVVLKNEQRLQRVVRKMEEENIFPRRYFYPSLNKLPYINQSQSCPISERVASSILCLPLYPGLTRKSISRICSILNKNNV